MFAAAVTKKEAFGDTEGLFRSLQIKLLVRVRQPLVVADHFRVVRRVKALLRIGGAITDRIEIAVLSQKLAGGAYDDHAIVELVADHNVPMPA
jgi:hypothetical protein